MTRFAIFLIVAALAAIVGAVLVYTPIFRSAHIASSVLNASTTPPIGNDNIEIANPLPESAIASPVSFSGRARGTYYFEAVFPVKVYDADGTLLGQGQAHAQSDWTTTDFVPFAGIVEFTQPKSATGTIVFANDNPSGDPARSKEFAVSVRFGADALPVGEGRIMGRVTLGPICPVERIPPDPNCAPKSWSGEIAAFSASNPGAAAQTAATDDKGSFTFTLPAGEYTVKALTQGVLPRCPEQTVSVAANRTETVAIDCDTGIR